MQPGKPEAGLSNAGDIQAAPPLLPRYLAGLYVALVIYASLYPFANWQMPGLSPFIFMEATWPRYWTTFDLATNVLAYLPLGFLLTQSPGRHAGKPMAAFVACALGIMLSFLIESAQSCLPSRVPSTIDLACNSLGAAIGALMSLKLGQHLFSVMVLAQKRYLAPVRHSEQGLVLIGLWMLTQLSPENVLFGTGDLRQVFNITSAVPYAAHSFFAIETGIVIFSTVAVGLLVRATLAVKQPACMILTALFVLALLIKTMAAAILVNPQNAFAWLTPGASLGLFLGVLLLCFLLLLPSSLYIALASLALMAGTILVNLAPFNPYSAAAFAAWQQGHFLNFNGLTRATASFWPFLALPYLILQGRRV